MGLFTHILEFQATVACHYDYKSITRTIRNTVDLKWSTLRSSISNSKKLCDEIIEQLDAEDGRARARRLDRISDQREEDLDRQFEMTQRQHAELLHELKVDQIERRAYQHNEKEIACLHVLRNSDYKRYKDRNPGKLANTCNWFLDHPNYQSWLAKQTSGLLWVSADPGCGKSVLSKSLVDEELRSTNERTTCYFFFKDNPDQNSVATALCALLHQLFEQKKFLISHAMPSYTHNGKALSMLFDSLWDILIDATADPKAGEVVCILDALDECENSEQKMLISALERLYSNSKEAGSPSLQFLVTSRPYLGIERSFRRLTDNAPDMRIASEEDITSISKEIDVVIKDKVRQIGRDLSLDKSVCSALQEKLLGTPQRTYLWLHLVIEEFDVPGLSQAEVETIIDTLPQTVNEAYKSILNKIAIEKRERAKRALHLVVAARRPLSLQEISIALATGDDDRFPDSLPSSDVLRSRIRNLCGLFLVVVGENVYLIHQTAKEFLVALDGNCPQNGLWQHCFKPNESNLALFKACASYLLSTRFEDDPLSLGDNSSDESGKMKRRRFREYLDKYLFLRYAAQYWSVHFQEAKTCDPKMLEAAFILVDTKSNHDCAWLRIYRQEDFYRMGHLSAHSTWTNIMLASYFGHVALVELLLADSKVDPNIKDKSNSTPLHMAAMCGYIDVVKLLLADHRVDLNARGCWGGSPLSLAVRGSKFDVVKLLLANPKVDPNSRDHSENDATPLLLAAEFGEVAIVELLLANPNVDPNLKDKRGSTPLYAAAARGELEVVKLLLANPQFDPNSKSLYEMILPRAAAIHGRIDVIRVLQTNPRVSPSFRNHYGRRPLGAAAQWGHADVVKLLLANPKVDPDMADCYEETPLSLAARDGQQATLALLLANHNVDPNHKNFKGWTPLHKAVSNHHVTIVERLLSHPRVDPNLKNTKNETPLHGAVENGSKDVVQVLLKSPKVDPNLEGYNGETPLQLATRLGHTEIIDLLNERLRS